MVGDDDWRAMVMRACDAVAYRARHDPEGLRRDIDWLRWALAQDVPARDDTRDE